MGLSVGVGSPGPSAKLALDWKIYDPDGGGLYGMLRTIEDTPVKATVATLKNETGRLFGVCVIDHTNLIAVYIVPEARGGGWGQRLLDAAVAADGRSRVDCLYAGPGRNFLKSIQFWHKNRVIVRSINRWSWYEALRTCLNQVETARWLGQDLCDPEGYVRFSALQAALKPVKNKNNCERILFDCDARAMHIEAFEHIYSKRLFLEGPLDQLNGLRGQLSAVWEENLRPFNRMYVHTSRRDYVQSFGTLRERTDGKRSFVEIQIFVEDKYRRQGLATEIIKDAKERYPHAIFVGQWNDDSKALFEAHQIQDITQYELLPWTQSYTHFHE